MNTSVAFDINTSFAAKRTFELNTDINFWVLPTVNDIIIVIKDDGTTTCATHNVKGVFPKKSASTAINRRKCAHKSTIEELLPGERITGVVIS